MSDFLSFFYLILAVLGLSFLIFIHELGHYYVARRNGMRVEVFSIGFGRPIYAWVKDGVKWQIGWLLFGGYVKISGMETSDTSDIYTVQNGFFSKSPWARIKVALAGPVTNIVFAFLAFTALWVVGGRQKTFSEYTHKIGWIDPHSELYKKGVRPGDEITSYNDNKLQGAKDHTFAPMTSGDTILVKGNQIDARTKEKTPFAYRLKTYPNPFALDKERLTAGVLAPASYLTFNKDSNPSVKLPVGSPLAQTGFKAGDRVVWADGIPVYSLYQLLNIINEPRALLTIRHGEDTLLRRVPRVKVEELRLNEQMREELVDWLFEARLNDTRLQNIYTIPYNLNNDGVVETSIKFIDAEKGHEAFPEHLYSNLEAPLQAGDRIIAVDGIPITHAYEILTQLQQRHVNVIIEHTQSKSGVAWTDADDKFDHEYNWNNLQQLTSKVGLNAKEKSIGNLTLLNPIVPKKRNELGLLTAEEKAQQEAFKAELRQEIAKIEDSEKRNRALHELDTNDHQLVIGFTPQDEAIRYNPNPVKLFDNVLEEIWHTLKALVSGTLNPKWMSGPIGIVHAVHDSSLLGWQEALFWLGAISLNLGVLNLLPLPVLDGGTILIALYELITGQRLKAKTIERLIVPFAVLLIGFFIFVTYYDITRLLHF